VHHCDESSSDSPLAVKTHLVALPNDCQGHIQKRNIFCCVEIVSEDSADRTEKNLVTSETKRKKENEIANTSTLIN
jgi:hypothetical protein